MYKFSKKQYDFIITFYYDRNLKKGYYTNSIISSLDGGKECLVYEKTTISHWKEFANYIGIKYSFNGSDNDTNRKNSLTLTTPNTNNTNNTTTDESISLFNSIEDEMKEEEMFFKCILSKNNEISYSNYYYNTTTSSNSNFVTHLPIVLPISKVDFNVLEKINVNHFKLLGGNLILEKIISKRDKTVIFYYSDIPITTELDKFYKR